MPRECRHLAAVKVAGKDEVVFAGHSEAGREQAAAMISSFREYIEEHKNDIRALQVLYSRPHKERLTFTEIKELAKAIERPPRQWTPDILWHAYELLDQSKVRGSGGKMLTDIVSLVCAPSYGFRSERCSALSASSG